MAVKRGYKLTEVGEIPEDWAVSTLGQVASVKTGPFGTLLSAAEYCEYDGVPMISVREIRDGFIRVSNETPRIPSTVVRRLPQFVLRAGDIVFGRKGGVDRSAIVNADEDGWFLGSDGISARLLGGIHNLYVAYQFRSKRIQNLLLQSAIGTTMPSLNQQILGNVSIPIPISFAEQVAIATALFDADALIESLEQLIAKKRLLKQASMQELLTGKRRLRAFDDKWRVGTLAEGISLFSGHHILAQNCNSEGIGMPYITGPADFPNGKIGHTKFTEWPSTICKAGDILITVKGSGAGSLVVADREYCISRQLMAIRVQEWSKDFVYYTLLSDSQRIGSASTGLIPGLSRSDILNTKLSIPTADEQSAIGCVLYDMDAEIQAIDARLAKARQIKQGMMQELLTGKIRLV